MAKQKRKAISKALSKSQIESALQTNKNAGEFKNDYSAKIPTNPQLNRVGPDAATKEQMSKLGETIGKNRENPYTFGRTNREAQAYNLVNPDVKVVRDEKGKKKVAWMKQKEKPFNEWVTDASGNQFKPAPDFDVYDINARWFNDPEQYTEYEKEKRRNPLILGQQDPDPNNLLDPKAPTMTDLIGDYDARYNARWGRSTTPEDRLKAQMDKNNAIPTLTNVLLDESTKNAQTSNELFEAPKLVDEAKQVAEKEISALDDTTAKVTSAPFGAFDDEDAESMVSGQAGNTNPVNADGTVTEPKPEVIPGNGQAITNVISTDEPQKPVFDQLATKEQIMNAVASQYLKDQNNVPYAVVEKLGIQDYYPNAGRNIAVGSFSGSRIGSQTIYSGAGALLPMGLYDARKRALKDAAKNKQAEIDKMLSIPDTTPQLKEAFSQYALNVKYDDLARNGFDPSKYNRDLIARRHDIELEATAKNLTYATEKAKALLESTLPKDGKPGAYMPEAQKKKLQELISGIIENPEDYFSGKKNIGGIYGDVKAYADGTVWVDGMIKTWLDKPTEVPVNLKTGQSLTEDQLAELNGALNGYLQAVQDGSADTDSYMTMIRKYYDIDEAIVDRWADAQGYSKDTEVRDTLKEYLRYQIPADSFVQSIKTSANQNVARARLQLDRDKFNYQKEQDKQSFWGTINAGMNDAINVQTGKSFEQELADLNKRNIKDKKVLDNELKKLYNTYSVSPQANLIKNDNGSWSVQMPSTSKQAEKIASRDIYAPNGKAIRTIKAQVWNKSTKSWETKNLAPRDIAKLKGKTPVAVNGRKLTDNEFEAYSQSAQSMYTKVIGHEITKGYIDPKSGNFVALNANNLDQYNANTKVTLQRTIEQPYAKIQVSDAKPGKTEFTEMLVPGQTHGEWIQISNSAGQQYSDEQSGFTTKQAAEAQGSGESTNVSSSGSGSSFSL